ncbi:MAG: Thiosulfate sulfurtransferase GlpE [Paracidovorax wautersii]|uniref:Thiosulfate sulfurtransferase GlpE n=1 Tax=Paracidovorax wautersii TaxID=1177982 RepID=A0A7V8FKL7_9BURK|nr:MAG: Thiosulfate sulfurtransferase GlpE [Paracidovorax wautersii]
MNFVTQNWMLILVALVSGGLLFVPALQGARSSLTAAAAVQRINREKGVLVDVRDAEEFAAGHARGAKHVPAADIDAKLPQTVKNKATPVIVMCATGNRAAKAVAQIKKLGYANVEALSGGLKAWRAAELPVEKSA